MEELATGKEVYGVEGLRATAQFFCGKYYNVRYTDPEKIAYTRLLNYDEQTVGMGICKSKNALVFPYANTVSDQNVPISLLCPLREYAIKKALREHSPAQESLFFVEEENVCVYAFDKGECV